MKTKWGSSRLGPCQRKKHRCLSLSTGVSSWPKIKHSTSHLQPVRHLEIAGPLQSFWVLDRLAGTKLLVDTLLTFAAATFTLPVGPGLVLEEMIPEPSLSPRSIVTPRALFGTLMDL